MRRSGRPTTPTARPYAVLIARHGRIVAEWNFRIDPLEPARMASASKSLYSSVLGIAIGEGVIRVG